jgi:hypothetical protein
VAVLFGTFGKHRAECPIDGAFPLVTLTAAGKAKCVSPQLINQTKAFTATTVAASEFCIAELTAIAAALLVTGAKICGWRTSRTAPALWNPTVANTNEFFAFATTTARGLWCATAALTFFFHMDAPLRRVTDDSSPQMD